MSWVGSLFWATLLTLTAGSICNMLPSKEESTISKSSHILLAFTTPLNLWCLLGKQSSMTLPSSWNNWWWHNAPKATVFSHRQMILGTSFLGGAYFSSLRHVSLNLGNSKIGRLKKLRLLFGFFPQTQTLRRKLKHSLTIFNVIFWRITGLFCSASVHTSHLLMFISFATHLLLSRHWASCSDGCTNRPNDILA